MSTDATRIEIRGEVGYPTASATILVRPETRTRRPMIGTYTDDEFSQLGHLPKKVTNPGARWSEKPTRHPVHRQRIYQATGSTEDGRQHRFLIYQRQSLRDDPATRVGSCISRRGDRGSRWPGTTDRTTDTGTSTTDLTSIVPRRPPSSPAEGPSTRRRKRRASRPLRVRWRV